MAVKHGFESRSLPFHDVPQTGAFSPLRFACRGNKSAFWKRIWNVSWAKCWSGVPEYERYKDSYRLCYVRGPEGIIVELAEQIG
jgi:hypothetical protein